MMKRLRRYLVAGILVWLPLGITIWIVTFLILVYMLANLLVVRILVG